MSSFLLKELAHTLITTGRALAWAAGAVIVSAASLLVLALLLVAASGWGENRLIVLFQPEVSSEQIRGLYRQVLKWEAVSEVSPPQDGVLRVTVRRLADIEEFEAALRELPGVSDVQTYKKGALRAALSAQDGAQTAAIFIAIVVALAALIALAAALRALVEAWAGELEILYLSGLPPPAIRWPFFGMTLLYALAGAVLAIVLLLLTRNSSEIHFWLPELWQPGGISHATLWILVFALGMGSVAGLLGAWTIRLKFY